MKKTLTIILLSSIAFVQVGCAPKLGGSDYDAKGVGDISRSHKGVIIASRPIMIHAADPTKPGIGAVAGGLGAGLLAGSFIGGGRGKIVSGLLGGAAGAAAGHVIEQRATEQEGREYQVKLSASGEVITITQGLEPLMSVGQKVIVVESSNNMVSGSSVYKGRSRVIPDNS